MVSSSQKIQGAPQAATELLSVAPSQRRQIFPAPAPPTPETSLEGAQYYVKLKGSTPLKPTKKQPAASQPIAGRTHSDPDTFAVFTAAPGSTFGKSDSFTFLQTLDDTTNQEDQENNAAYNVAQAAAEAALGMDYEYSDDEDDMKMDRDSFDEPLNDAELVQLAHPLASLSG